jgi:hypothetical protein
MLETSINELARAAIRFRQEAELNWIDYCLERLHVIARPSNASDSDAGVAARAAKQE